MIGNVFDLFLYPIAMCISFLNKISVLGVSLSSYIIFFVVCGVIFSFLRGGSND